MKDRKPIVFKKTVMMIEVPINVKCQFKAHCSRRGKTMTETLILMMRREYRVDKRIPKRKGKEC